MKSIETLLHIPGASFDLLCGILMTVLNYTRVIELEARLCWGHVALTLSKVNVFNEI